MKMPAHRTRQPTLLHVVNAQLPILPEPLRLLHGPLLATVETWSDGTVVARLPVAALYGEGDSDTLALDDLAEGIGDFVASVSELLRNGDQIGGPLATQWRALIAMVDVSAVR